MKKKLLLLLALTLIITSAALASCDMIEGVAGKLPFGSTTAATPADPFASVTFENVSGQYNGEAKTMAVANLPAGAVVVYSIDGAAPVPTVSIVDAGTYTVEAQMTSATGETGTKTATMTISKADYTLENAEQYFATENTVPYDGGYHTPEPIIDLPAGLSFMADAAPISNPGESATYNISFAFSDPAMARNYNPPAGISGITLTIGKATLDFSGVSFEDRTVNYDGSVQKLEVANLPSNLRVTYSYTDASGAPLRGAPLQQGVYTVTATFAFKDAKDAQYYEIPAPMTATLTIGAGEVALPNIFIDKSVTYSGNSQYPVVPGTIDGIAAIDTVVTNAAGDVLGEDDVVLPGVYNVTVSFTVTDTDKYLTPDPISYTLTIVKAPINAAAPVWGPVGEWDVVVGDSGYFVLSADGTNAAVGITLPAEFAGLDITVTYKHTINGIAASEFSIAGLYTTTAVITLNSDLYEIPAGYNAGSFTWLLADKEVNVADITFADKTVDYNGEAHNIELGYEGVAGILGATVVVTDESGKVVDFANGFINAGVYTYTVTFETDAAKGYAPLTVVKKLTVNKALIDLSVVNAEWDFTYTDGKAYIVFDGENHVVVLTEATVAALAERGVSVSYEGNKAKAPGEYVAIAVLACDENHVLSVDSFKFAWQIANTEDNNWTEDPVQ